MNKHQLLRKLGQIEEVAQHALLQPPGARTEYMRLIIGLARYLATEVELDSRQRRSRRAH